MKARAVGRSALNVSLVGLGAGRIGGSDCSDAAVDRLLGAALDAGITLLDTARSYGLSEERLGRSLRGRRDRFVLSTKVGYGTPGIEDWTDKCIAAGIEAALGRLQTDHLDLVFLHSCDQWILEQRGVAEALGRAVEEGKVRVAGYSGENEPLGWAVRSGKFGAVQCSVSVVDPAGLRSAVPEAQARGVGVFAKRPLGNAPWRFAQRPEEGDVAEAWERYQKLPKALGGLPPEEVALRFSAFAPGVASILVGTANPEHLLAAARSVEKGPLPEEITQAIHAAWASVGEAWRGRV
jgi:aryl-alcohol dehydrogenase-like predicted oxidoreductase